MKFELKQTADAFPVHFKWTLSAICSPCPVLVSASASTSTRRLVTMFSSLQLQLQLPVPWLLTVHPLVIIVAVSLHSIIGQ